mgnify:CR=1 FL=1
MIFAVPLRNGPSWVDHVDYKFFNSTGKFVNSRRTMKGSVSEGGIRVPMIASWPNKIKPGSISNHISAFYDFFETACDVYISKPFYWSK